MSPLDRKIALLRFSAVEVDIGTSVDQQNEGVEVPDIDLGAFMCATYSRCIRSQPESIPFFSRLYAQDFCLETISSRD